MDSPVVAYRAPTSIGRLLDQTLDRAAGQPGAAAIWRLWDEVVGDAIARRAQPVRLRKRTLVIAVSSAPWMQELHMLKRSMIEALNARLPQPLVDELHLVLTEYGAPARERPPAPPAPRTCGPAPSDALLADLPEPLRESFTGVLEAWRRRARRSGA
jgi:predicted nucleic acid-binding Zn ribbon protein